MAEPYNPAFFALRIVSDGGHLHVETHDGIRLWQPEHAPVVIRQETAGRVAVTVTVFLSPDAIGLGSPAPA